MCHLGQKMEMLSFAGNIMNDFSNYHPAQEKNTKERKKKCDKKKEVSHLVYWLWETTGRSLFWDSEEGP